MNNKLRNAIRRQRMRQIHKSVLIEMRLLKEETLWKTFVEPFADVLDAAKLTGQDILSSTKFAFDLLTSFSPEAVEQATQNFDKRQEDLSKKWEPILERNAEALASGDADIIAFALAPALFVTSEAFMRGIDKYNSLEEYMDETGMGEIFRGVVYGSAGLALGGPAGAAAGIAIASDRTKGAKDKKKKAAAAAGGAAAGAQDKEYSTLEKLAGLFYIGDAWKRDIKPESITRERNVILEQEENKGSMKQQLEDYLDKIGFVDAASQDAPEILKMQEEYLTAVVNEAVPKLKLMTALSQASDLKSFTDAIKDAKTKGIDVASAGLGQLESQISQSVESLVKSEEFRAQLIEEKKGSNQQKADDAATEEPTLSDDEVAKAAQKVAFVNAKQNFDQKVVEGQKSLKTKALEMISAKTPDDSSLAILKQSKDGKKYIKLIDDAKQAVNDA